MLMQNNLFLFQMKQNLPEQQIQIFDERKLSQRFDFFRPIHLPHFQSDIGGFGQTKDLDDDSDVEWGLKL